MRLFFILILLYSLAEIGILIWIGTMIGVFWVMALIVLTSLFGFLFGRMQGFETWNRTMQQLERNRVPSGEFIDGICIIIGAFLLISPGFISNAIGLLLLVPFTRSPLKKTVGKLLDKMVNKGFIFYRRY